MHNISDLRNSKNDIIDNAEIAAVLEINVVIFHRYCNTLNKYKQGSHCSL